MGIEKSAFLMTSELHQHCVLMYRVSFF